PPRADGEHIVAGRKQLRRKEGSDHHSAQRAVPSAAELPLKAHDHDAKRTTGGSEAAPRPLGSQLHRGPEYHLHRAPRSHPAKIADDPNDGVQTAQGRCAVVSRDRPARSPSDCVAVSTHAATSTWHGPPGTPGGPPPGSVRVARGLPSGR